MIQHLLDEHAQTNAISHISPVTKLLLGIGTLTLILISTTPAIPIISGLILSIVIIGIARIPAGLFARFLMIPAGFTLLSVGAILLLSGGKEILWELSVTSWLSLSISKEGIGQSIEIITRVLGGTISLLFISLTTPFTDIIRTLNQCRFPQELTDLMTILYRNIFILLDQATQIHAAQVMRLGYSSPREATESFGMLCGSLFISTWNAGDDLIRAMDCRCYNGKFAPLILTEPVRFKSMTPAILFLLLLSVILIFHSLDFTSGGI